MDDVRRAITFVEEVAPVVNGACWADGVHWAIELVEEGPTFAGVLG